MPQRQASGLTPRPEGRAPEGTVGGGKDAESMSAVGAGGMCEA